MRIPTPKKLADILHREFDALDHFIAPESETFDSNTTLTWPLNRAYVLVLTFPAPVTDLQEKRARLVALSESFADLFAEAAPECTKSRPEPTQTLQSELDALAGSANAICALVIDAKSPVIWGASEAPTNADEVPLDEQLHQAFVHAHEIGISWRNILAHPPGSLHVNERKESKTTSDPNRVLRLVPPIDEFEGLTPAERDIIGPCAERIRIAISRVRANPVLGQLHRGEHLHEAIHDESVAYIARSFATIYVLILVFPGLFDELGAERAMHRALPLIERLVISLPPDDTTPDQRKGAVVALRPRRR